METPRGKKKTTATQNLQKTRINQAKKQQKAPQNHKLSKLHRKLDSISCLN